MSSWQPIETAPKDGTEIRVGHLMDDASMKADSIFKTFGTFKNGRWQCSSAFVCTDMMIRWNPTHWLPPTGGRRDE